MAGIALPADENETAPLPNPADELARWRRWLILTILLSGGIKTTLAFTTVVPALQLISDYFSGTGDDVLNAQMIVTMAPVGMAVAGLLAGWVVGKGNLRRTLFVSLGICAMAGLAQLVIESLYVLLVSRFFLGVAVVTSDVAMTSILAAQFAGKTRSRIIGFRQAISSTGTVTTMLAAGWLAQHYGWRAPSWMFLFPLLMLVLAVIAWNRPIDIGKRQAVTERFNALQLWPLFLLSTITSTAHAMPSFQMPFLLETNGITSAVLVSRVPALSAFISVLSAMAFGYIYGRVGRVTLMLAAIFMGVGFIGVAFAPTYELILLCVIVEGVGAGLTIPYFQARLLDRISPLQRSKAIGFLTTSLFLGHFLNPLVTAPLRLNFGIHNAFLIFGLFLIIGAAILAVWAGRTRRTESVI